MGFFDDPKLGHKRCYADIEFFSIQRGVWEDAIIPFASVEDGNAWLDTIPDNESPEIEIQIERIEYLGTYHEDKDSKRMVQDIKRTREVQKVIANTIDCFRLP